MITKKIHELNQTWLGRRTLKYNLCETENEEGLQYGIQLIVNSESQKEEIAIENISNNKQYVLDLITYLYENAIDTIHFRDVIIDYMNSLD